MITTEKEAKKKVCIDVRLRASTQPGATSGFNRSKMTTREKLKDMAIARFFPSYYHWTRGQYVRCVASGCMAWRQVDRDRGYCGRAGTPQGGYGAGPPPSPAPTVQTRDDGGTRAGDVALMVGTAAAVAVLAYAARVMIH